MPAELTLGKHGGDSLGAASRRDVLLEESNTTEITPSLSLFLLTSGGVRLRLGHCATEPGRPTVDFCS